MWYIRIFNNFFTSGSHVFTEYIILHNISTQILKNTLHDIITLFGLKKYPSFGIYSAYGLSSRDLRNLYFSPPTFFWEFPVRTAPADTYFNNRIFTNKYIQNTCFVKLLTKTINSLEFSSCHFRLELSYFYLGNQKYKDKVGKFSSGDDGGCAEYSLIRPDSKIWYYASLLSLQMDGPDILTWQNSRILFLAQ